MNTSGRTWRVIDTGLRPAAENIAFNQALLEGHQAGCTPHTLRFLRFEPAALIGFHQHVEQELNVEYCRTAAIDIQRRITGGGAIYFDESQFGWELYLDKAALGTSDMQAISRRICEAAAEGLRKLGIAAAYRPRNDIEVDGRKISGTGGAFDGDSILFQGTLLVNFDVERMLRVLRIPAEKLSDKAVQSARERVVNLTELLGCVPDMREVQAHMSEAFARAFDVALEPGTLSDEEQVRFAQALQEIDRPEWIWQHNRPRTDAPILEGVHRCSGGLMRAHVALDATRDIIKQVWITGDFFVNPRRMVLDLEAALKDTAAADFARNVDRFFRNYPVQMLMLERADFIAVIGNALAGQSGRQSELRA